MAASVNNLARKSSNREEVSLLDLLTFDWQARGTGGLNQQAGWSAGSGPSYGFWPASYDSITLLLA